MDPTPARLQNFLLLYAQHASEYMLDHPNGDGDGLDLEFAKRLQISKSTLSRMKHGKCQIGIKLARQFEAIFKKPVGWMDEARTTSKTRSDQGLADFLRLSMLVYEKANDDQLVAITSYLQAQAGRMTKT